MDSSDPHERARESQPLGIDETAMFGAGNETSALRAGQAHVPGDTFGRYRILKTLGQGAMGSVHLAHDTQLDRKVAIKIPKFTVGQDARFIERFLREARSAATLSHPNICPVFDVGEIDGTHFITMAYIQGHPLSEFVNPDRPQRDRNVANTTRKIALALQEAHRSGLVHRDVKPANIMIDQRNEPIIMDFGLARPINNAEDSRLTKDGAILGSPAYMSPEQIEGQPDKLGPACDIYSLGVILFELLTGQLPFQGSIASIIGQVLSKEADSPAKLRPDIDPRLAAICQRAMAKQVEDRFTSMQEFANALTEFLMAKPEAKSRSAPPAGPTSQPSKKTGTDTNSGLKLTAAPTEFSCGCGQRLSARRHLAGKQVRCPRCGDSVTVPGTPAAESTQRIDVSCMTCGQRFMARAALAGKVVKCPVCGKPLTVVRPGQAVPAAKQIEVTCGCGQQFLAKAQLAGRRVTCTSCGKPLIIPTAN